MNPRSLGPIVVGASFLLLLGYGGSATAPAPSAAAAATIGHGRQSAPEISLTYPVGMVGGHRFATLRHVQRSRGWISPQAKGAKVLFVANLGGDAVDIYKQKGQNQQPMGTITTGINFPAGMTVDKSGNLYVANEGANNVTVYPPGQTSPSITYTTDLSTATDIAVANDGTVYISNFNGLANGWVSVYPQGNTSKEYRLSDFSGGAPLSVALDSSQNLYVMYDLNGSGSSAVNEYAPGATTGTNLNLTFHYGAGIQVDKSGDILVVQQIEPSEILEFPPGQTQPSQEITLPSSGQPFNFALSKSDKVLFAGDATHNLEQSLKYPSGTFRYTMASGFQNPSGTAVSPD